MERLFVGVEIEINRSSTTTNKKSEKGAPDKPCGEAVQMLTQKHVAKRYMIAKK